MRSKTSLDSSRKIAQDCGDSFVNCLYLITLIIGQKFCATHATSNQTEPKERRMAMMMGWCSIDQCSECSAAGWEANELKEEEERSCLVAP